MKEPYIYTTDKAGKVTIIVDGDAGMSCKNPSIKLEVVDTTIVPEGFGDLVRTFERGSGVDLNDTTVMQHLERMRKK